MHTLHCIAAAKIPCLGTCISWDFAALIEQRADWSGCAFNVLVPVPIASPCILSIFAQHQPFWFLQMDSAAQPFLENDFLFEEQEVNVSQDDDVEISITSRSYDCLGRLSGRQLTVHVVILAIYSIFYSVLTRNSAGSHKINCEFIKAMLTNGKRDY